MYFLIAAAIAVLGSIGLFFGSSGTMNSLWNLSEEEDQDDAN